MNHRSALVALAISWALSPALLGADNNSKTYKWVDDHGVTHYGDTVPPEFARQGRSELNAQGVELRKTPRQLSPEEADVAQKQAREEARRRQHDSFLLTTYTKVSDIEQLRDERVALIDGQMEIARGSIESNQQRINEMETRLRTFAPYSSSPTARRVPDQMAQEVVRMLRERDQLRSRLKSREKEKSELRAQFDGDIARYRELTRRPAER